MTQNNLEAQRELKRIEPFMVRADIAVLNCVDERQSDGVTNGVEIPGGIYGVVDAVKAIKHVSEDEAWNMVRDAGIPLGAHIDDEHGPMGCGYGKLVVTKPWAVLAVASVEPKDRLARIEKLGGTIVTYFGHHHPTHALINHRKGYSFDPEAAAEADIGVFSYDYWAAEIFAEKLGIDKQQLASHLEKVFKATVENLSDLRQFLTIG